MVAQFLAEEGDKRALSYIEALSKFRPADAEGIRAGLAYQQRNKSEAIDHLLNFFEMAHNDPWIDRDVISRSMNRAEAIAKSDGSRDSAERFYEALKTRLCVWNADTERVIKLLSLSRYLDGSSAGRYTANAVETVEPNLFWTRSFLEMRNNAYRATQNRKAVEAATDLDQFMNNEAFTADSAAVTKVLKAQAQGGTAYATERPTGHARGAR